MFVLFVLALACAAFVLLSKALAFGRPALSRLDRLRRLS